MTEDAALPRHTAQLDDVFVAYPAPGGVVMALRGLTLAIAESERLLIQGPNGSGKSTLLKVLTGEQPVTAGTVTAAGTELSAASDESRRRWRARHIGIIDQHARRALLPELSVLDNIALQLRLIGFSGKASRRSSTETLERLELGHLAGRRIRGLSGGEAQRVAICAAMAHGPSLVLADEPTGELDDGAAREVYEMLSQVGGLDGTSLVLVSHDARAAGIADRAIRIRDGRVAEQWEPASGLPEEQVVDARGWIRLPDGTPSTTGRATTLRADQRPDGVIVLRPTGPPFSVAESEPAFDDVPAGPAVPGLGDDDGPLLELRTVTARFGERTVFSAFDLELFPGDWTVLRGPSGSGKSTMLALAAGLADPDEGAVLVAGRSLGPLDRAERAELRRTAVSLGLQQTTLAEALTVRENLTIASLVRGRDNDGAAWEIANRLGLRRLWDQPVRSLSGGERQRVALARALVSRAPLLVLDEPTSAQDEVAAAWIVAALTDVVRSGRAVLAASHDEAFCAAAKKVVMLG